MKLLNCHFCGSTEVYLKSLRDSHNKAAQCNDCLALGPSKKDKKDAINSWNTKAKKMKIAVVADQLKDGGFKHYLVFGDDVAPWDAKSENIVKCEAEEDAHKLEALIHKFS